MTALAAGHGLYQADLHLNNSLGLASLRELALMGLQKPLQLGVKYMHKLGGFKYFVPHHYPNPITSPFSLCHLSRLTINVNDGHDDAIFICC